MVYLKILNVVAKCQVIKFLWPILLHGILLIHKSKLAQKQLLFLIDHLDHLISNQLKLHGKK